LGASLEAKCALVVGRLSGVRGLVVALSGGVDSSVLLLLALRALGRDRVLAATGRSPSLARSEMEDAAGVAMRLGARHLFVDTGELGNPEYRANTGQRCFHCRDELFRALRDVARREGLAAIAYGAIADDLEDDRPGMRAAASHGVLAPLIDAGLTKDEVREVAATAGIAVSDKPAGACLSSRIPVGTEVTPERLRQVEDAEAGLRSLGLRRLRVRHHGDVARLELDAEGERLLADPDFRSKAALAVRRAGFRFATLDLEGYRRAGLATPLLSLGPTGSGPNRDAGQ